MVRLWSIFFNETFRISYCELDKHVGQLRLNFWTFCKNHFFRCHPYLHLQHCEEEEIVCGSTALGWTLFMRVGGLGALPAPAPATY